jgi:membrane-associated phospholipid phosphatase
VNFLSPLFLLGALAVAGPIIFHLIRRTTREVKPFSSLMFLQPTPPRVTRRSRLENLWLLLLRCLVLLALALGFALGFARPFFRESTAKNAGRSAAGRRVAILVDTSASTYLHKFAT